MSTRHEGTVTDRRGRGFTLVELLVAVGVVGLIAVGITQVFTLTSETVRQGRRLSNLLQSANLIERQLREDFAKMTRDGFLVIRHAYTTDSPTNTLAVAVTKTDTAPRARRVDELMFFAKGDFTSAREPLHPARVPAASEARIYYGHGLRQIVGATPTSYARPSLLDTNPASAAPPLGVRVANVTSPNRYAADWSLLRQVTLLARPDPTPRGGFTPAPVSGILAGVGARDDRLKDSTRQIMLQPAAQSLFRSLARNSNASSTDMLRASVNNGLIGPLFASGLVDIAATDLAEVRAIVLSGPEDYLGRGDTGPIGLDASAAPFVGFVGGDRTPGGAARPDRVRMQRWMMDALPADSDGRDRQTDPYANPTFADATRMRYESVAPDLLDKLGLGRTSGTDLNPQVLRADQQMLTASVFAPRCTEFIVEWSFGTVDDRANRADSPTAGRVIWHGLRRLVDLNNDGLWDRDLDYGVLPYPRVYDTNDDGDPTGPETSWPTGRVEKSFEQTFVRADGTVGRWGVWPALIHPNFANTEGNLTQPGGGLRPTVGPVMYSLFGYVDPTYTPELPIANPGAGAYTSPVTGKAYSSQFAFNADVLRFDANPPVPGSADLVTFDPREGDQLRDPLTLPWAWPVMVRVTMTLADPVDATVKQTFQVVVPVPAADGAAF